MCLRLFLFFFVSIHSDKEKRVFDPIFNKRSSFNFDNLKFRGIDEFQNVWFNTSTANTRIVRILLYFAVVLHVNNKKGFIMKSIKTTLANRDIRQAVEDANLYLWQVADEIGVTDCTFSRYLRKELSNENKATIFQAIEKLKKDRAAQFGGLNDV